MASLRVHPPVALAAGGGGEFLELSKALLSRDTGLCPLSRSPCLPLPGPPWPGCTAKTPLPFSVEEVWLQVSRASDL